MSGTRSCEIVMVSVATCIEYGYPDGFYVEFLVSGYAVLLI